MVLCKYITSKIKIKMLVVKFIARVTTFVTTRHTTSPYCSLSSRGSPPYLFQIAKVHNPNFSESEKLYWERVNLMNTNERRK